MNGDVPENFLAEAFYRDVLGEFSRFKSTTGRVNTPHWAVPSHTLHAEKPVSSVPIDSRFPYKVSRPTPYLPPANVNPLCFQRGDPLDSIVKEKQKWEGELQALIRLARKGKKWAGGLKYSLSTGKVKQKDASKPVYSISSYADVAKHVSIDPHPYFSGNYNWLATGGCLSHYATHNGQYVIFPTGASMDCLSFKAVRKEKSEFENQSLLSTNLRLSKDQRIYQIVAKHCDSKGLAAIRQKKICSLVSLRESSKETLCAQSILEIQEKDGLFICIDLNCSESKQLCTLDSDHLLRVWDLNTSSCLANSEIPSPLNESFDSSWGSVKFNRSENEIIVLNRRKVFLKDQRIPLAENAQEFCSESIVDDCEELMLSLTSHFPYLTYVATNHRLLSLDLRKGWAQRWTHLLEAPPMYGSVFADTRCTEEVVLLSSSVADDTVAIVNRWDGQLPESQTFPIGLPSLGDVLLMARSHGKCLKPSFSKRMFMATAGLTVLPSKNDGIFTSLKSTSIGDIFSQQFFCETVATDQMKTTMTKEEILSEVDIWQKWDEAQEEICSKRKPTLACPVQTNEALFNAIKSPISDKTLEKTLILNWHETFPSKKVKKSKPPTSSSYAETLCELDTYKDLMAGVLLQAWDAGGLTAPLKSSAYVESWLDSVPFPPIGDTCGSPDGQESRRRPCLMSAYEQGTEPTQPQPTFLTPSSRPVKRMKRESLGF